MFRINRGKKFGLTVLNYMEKIGVLTGPKDKIRIIRVFGLTVFGLTVFHCMLLHSSVLLLKVAFQYKLF